MILVNKMSTMRSKESLSVTVKYNNDYIDVIDDIKEIKVFMDKTDTPQYYIFKKKNCIIHIPFRAVSRIEIEGTKNAIIVPDFYS